MPSPTFHACLPVRKRCSHTLKITASCIIVVELAIHDIFGKFSLTLSGFLSILKLQPVLVHGEPHCLRSNISMARNKINI
jgi:hypothetical protein